jgi:hypothetical protein
VPGFWRQKNETMKNFKSEDLVKWNVLARLFCNHRMSIAKTRIPKKHQAAINELLSLVQGWYTRHFVTLNKKVDD